jgi:hypothetical protein
VGYVRVTFRDVTTDIAKERTGSRKKCKERKEKGKSKEERNGKQEGEKRKRSKTVFQSRMLCFKTVQYRTNSRRARKHICIQKAI